MLSPDAQMIDRRILQEARTLVAAGYAVDVLSGFECAAPDAYEEHGYRVKRYRYDWRDPRREAFRRKAGAAAPLWPFARLATRLSGGPTAFEAYVMDKALEHRFDVVHVHDFPMLRAGALIARKRGAPLIYDSHEFYPVQACFSPADQKRYLALEGRLARDCAAIITVNPYLARMIGEAHGIAAPQVILNACEPPAIDAAALDAGERARRRRALGLPADKTLFLYQGWLSPERNLETMVAAMAAQSAAALAIVGYGAYEETLKALARDRGVEDRVVFLGRIENERLAEVTALADVGVVPYKAVDEMHRYCSPNKLFEFIAAGIPVLASDLPYLRDVVAGHGVGWLGALDEETTFSTLIARIAASPAERAARQARVGAAFAALNWENEGRKLLAIYDRVTGGAGAAR